MNIEELINTLGHIPEGNWTKDSLEDAIRSHIEAKQGMIGEYLWPMRVALTGRKASPGPFEIAEILGKTETLKRIRYALTLIENI